MKTSVSSPWLPVAFAGIVLLAIHCWYVAFSVRAEFSFQHALSAQDAVVASLLQLPQTVAWLLPAWLPFVVPAAHAKLKRWVTVAYAAVALGLALSLFVMVALRQELFFLAVWGRIRRDWSALCASVGVSRAPERGPSRACRLTPPSSGRPKAASHPLAGRSCRTLGNPRVA